jgi:hypothetical protein
MTHEEALRELGLDADATPDQNRRAYFYLSVDATGPHRSS